MKIVDRREIEFDQRSVVKAIGESPTVARRFGLPPSRPVGVRFHPRTGAADVLYGQQFSMQPVSISAEALGAILISYCLRNNIPMPRTATKGIRIEASSVILAFRMKFEDTARSAGTENVLRLRGSMSSPKARRADGATDVKI